MELDELKSAWNKITSENDKIQLNENEINNLLKKRTLDISEKIGRNIRVGMGIILGWVCLGFAIDFLFSPVLENYLNKPYLTDQLMFWSFMIEVFNYVLIFTTIIIFWIRYSKIEKQKIDSVNLHNNLQQLIKILDSYRVMFYIVLFIVLLYVIISFSSGFFMEYNYQVQQSAIDLSHFKFMNWAIVIFVFLFVLGIIIAIYYLLFNFFFKRLYGRYLKQLKSTLKELNEAHT
jgi:hypothetical protein